MNMFYTIIYLIPVAGIVALAFTYIKSKWVTKQEVGTEKMARIAKNIADGAMAFLKAEYRSQGYISIVIKGNPPFNRIIVPLGPWNSLEGNNIIKTLNEFAANAADVVSASINN